MSLMENEKDVVVVGAGLAGLTAAVSLAQRGRTVCVVERLSFAGGLCGNWTIDGYEFIRACNEFGGHIAGLLRSLNVEVSFAQTRSRVYLGESVLHLPPTAGTITRLLPGLPGFARLFLTARRGQCQTLGDLIESSRAGDAVADIVGVLASLAAVPVQHIRLDETRDVMTVHRGYGWNRPVKPVGGPQAIVDGLVKRLTELNGELVLDTECLGVARGEDGVFRVATSRGEWRARHVVSSEPRWAEYPAASARGLAHGQILLAVKDTLRFPRGIQTLYHVPRGVRAWMNDLAEGRVPTRFGFNLVRNLLPKREGHETLVGFFALPQGEDELSESRRRVIESYYLEAAERMLPGLARAVLYKRLLSPADFKRFHGLMSRPVAVLAPPGIARLPNFDSKTGVYHVGISVYPPGNDANAAVHSGAHVADLIGSALSA